MNKAGEISDTSLFVGMVPANGHQYVVVSLVEQGGFGAAICGADRPARHRGARGPAALDDRRRPSTGPTDGDDRLERPAERRRHEPLAPRRLRCCSRLPLAITGLGLLMIYSSTRIAARARGHQPALLRRAAGSRDRARVVAMVVVIVDRLPQAARLWPLAVPRRAAVARSACSSGPAATSAQAWFQVGPLQFQPSEITKVVLSSSRSPVTAISIGRSRRLAARGRARHRRPCRWRSCILQHDLGTTLVILVVLVRGRWSSPASSPLHIGGVARARRRRSSARRS